MTAPHDLSIEVTLDLENCLRNVAAQLGQVS